MQWKVIGPGGGGGQFYPTISPHDHNIVLEACDMTNGYISYNAGKTWRAFQLGTPPHAYAFDPIRPDVMYAGAHGLFRSDDCGKRWRLVFPNPDSGVEQRHQGDHAGIVLKAPPPWPERGGSVHAIAVDPDDPKSVYAAIFAQRFGSGGRREQGGRVLLYHSSDDAKSFSLLGEFPGDASGHVYNRAQCLYIDPTSPKDARTVFLCTAEGLYKSMGGKPFEPVALPKCIEGISCAAAGRIGDQVVISVASGADVVTSTDGGATWVQGLFPRAPRGPIEAPENYVFALAACENDARVIYASLSLSVEWDNNKKKYERFCGVMKSQDAGRTWRWVNKAGEKGRSPTFDSGWIADYGGWWGGYPLKLGVAPNDPDICYGTDFGTSHKTENGGDTWEQVYTVPCRDNAFTTNGMDVTTCYGLHADPHDPDHIAISYTDIGLFDSRDGGKSWVHRLNGVPREWINTCYWLEYDPEVPGRAWSVWGNGHDLPRPKMFGPRFDWFMGGVCRTEDGFVTNEKANEGMNEYSDCTHILLDPDSPAGLRTLYVCAFGKGVFKSVVDGHEWTLQNEGIDAANLNAWRIVRDSAGKLYLIVSRGGREGPDQIPGALYVSDDKAQTWKKLPLPQGVTAPNGLAIDPRDESHMYLACWPRSDGEREFAGGVWESFDAGQTWANIYDERIHAYDVTIHPENPDVLFVCGFNSAIFRSDDAGKTWVRLGGYRFKWGHRVVVDEYNPGMIYVTTFGGSVYHGPERGDPDAIEDVVEYARPGWEAPVG